MAARTPTHRVPGLEPTPGRREYAPILIGRPHDTARSTPGFGPLSALPPPPGDRRPNSRFRAAASPSRRLFFSPDAAAPAYNASYMRPLDALTRHASSWGRLVTISVFAVLTAALVMAVWWAATTEERTGTYVVRGTVNGITLDIGDADLDIIGGGTQAALQVSRTDRFAFGHPAEAERVVRGGTLRLRSRCPAALIGSCSSVLPPARPRQCARHGQDHERGRGVQRLSRLGARRHDHGRRELQRLVRLQPPDPRGRGRRPGGRGVLARAPAAALAPGPRRRARARRAATASTPRATRAAAASAASTSGTTRRSRSRRSRRPAT